MNVKWYYLVIKTKENHIMKIKEKYDNVYWRMQRRMKEIPLTGALSKYVGCSYNHIAQFEKKPNHPMQEDKIERYIAFIEAYPNEPSNMVQ
jgi:hypothetical protein